MSVREYIGARYVPLFIGDWNNTNTYEPLSIVNHEGNSYTSRQFVPAGIAIDNTAYWALTGNYNAQIEQYRQEVQQFDSRIDAVEDSTADIEAVLPISEFDEDNTVKDTIDNLQATVQNSILTYDPSTLPDFNAEANAATAYRNYLIYNQLTRELFMEGVFAAADQDAGFTRGTNVKLFTLPTTIPRPTSQVYVYAMFRCANGAVGLKDTEYYYSPGLINTDGEVIVQNLAGFTSPETVKNIVCAQNVLHFSSKTSVGI